MEVSQSMQVVEMVVNKVGNCINRTILFLETKKLVSAETSVQVKCFLHEKWFSRPVVERFAYIGMAVRPLFEIIKKVQESSEDQIVEAISNLVLTSNTTLLGFVKGLPDGDPAKEKIMALCTETWKTAQQNGSMEFVHEHAHEMHDTQHVIVEWFHVVLVPYIEFLAEMLQIDLDLEKFRMLIQKIKNIDSQKNLALLAAEKTIQEEWPIYEEQDLTEGSSH